MPLTPEVSGERTAQAGRTSTPAVMDCWPKYRAAERGLSILQRSLEWCELRCQTLESVDAARAALSAHRSATKQSAKTVSVTASCHTMAVPVHQHDSGGPHCVRLQQAFSHFYDAARRSMYLDPVPSATDQGCLADRDSADGVDDSKPAAAHPPAHLVGVTPDVIRLLALLLSQISGSGLRITSALRGVTTRLGFGQANAEAVRRRVSECLAAAADLMMPPNEPVTGDADSDACNLAAKPYGLLVAMRRVYGRRLWPVFVASDGVAPSRPSAMVAYYRNYHPRLCEEWRCAVLPGRKRSREWERAPEKQRHSSSMDEFV